jgi:curved DNA-binding protein CbpA
MKYFNVNNDTTLDELKAQYRKLCFKLHPDKGGDEREFVAMKNEYHSLLNRYDKRTERNVIDTLSAKDLAKIAVLIVIGDYDKIFEIAANKINTDLLEENEKEALLNYLKAVIFSKQKGK